jgi:hypothetical protein
MATDNELVSRVIDDANKYKAGGAEIGLPDGGDIQSEEWGVIFSDGQWCSTGTCACPLGAVLVVEQPPYKYTGLRDNATDEHIDAVVAGVAEGDDSHVATIAALFDRPKKWVEGFVSGVDNFLGQTEDADQRAGYTAGREVARRLGLDERTAPFVLDDGDYDE